MALGGEPKGRDKQCFQVLLEKRKIKILWQFHLFHELASKYLDADLFYECEV